MDDQKFEQWLKEQQQIERARRYQWRRMPYLWPGIGLVAFAGLILLRCMWW